MKYELLNNISGAVVLLVVTLVFAMVFEPRYSKKKYLSSLIPFLILLLGVNFYLIFSRGFTEYGDVTLFTATLPSMLYFFLVARHRDGRFFFTFCLVDTSSIWFAIVTGLVDYYTDAQGMFNFWARLLAAPIILFVIYRWCRRPFLSFIHTVPRGWWLFTAMTGMVYILLITLTNYSLSLRQRPEDIPLAVMLMIFLPLTYIAIFYSLKSQRALHEMGTIQHAFDTQSNLMETRARELRSAEEKLQEERSSMRQQLMVLEELTIRDQREEVLRQLGEMQTSLEQDPIPHCCANPVLDAILSSCFRQAEEAKIALDVHLNIPDPLPVPAADLATLFSNALENAIQACSKLPIPQRKLKCVCTSEPSLMFQVKNPFEGTVFFDRNGLPLSRDPGKGMGSRSIAAFCKKHDASYSCTADKGWFTLMVGL